MKLDIKKFNGSDDAWFDEGQQQALRAGVGNGARLVIDGIEAMNHSFVLLSEQWHSKDAATYGNPVKDDFNKLAPEVADYMNSIGNWMTAHALTVNSLNGNDSSLTELNETVRVNVGEFTDDASHRGFENESTARRTRDELREAYERIDYGLKQIVDAVESNPDAMPYGVVPNDLQPTVAQQNGKVRKDYDALSEPLGNFINKISDYIKEEAQKAAQDAHAN